MKKSILRLTAAMVFVLLMLGGCGKGNTDEIYPEHQENEKTVNLSFYDMNVTLSSIAEQGITQFSPEHECREQIIEYACNYIAIHKPQLIEEKQLGYGATYKTVSLNKVNEELKSLLGIELSEEEVNDYIVTKYDGDVIKNIYKSGEFYFQVLEQKKINTVVAAEHNFFEDTDGIKVKFTVYDISACTSEPDNLYMMDSMQLAQEKGIKAKGTGEAIYTENADGKYLISKFLLN